MHTRRLQSRPKGSLTLYVQMWGSWIQLCSTKAFCFATQTLVKAQNNDTEKMLSLRTQSAQTAAAFIAGFKSADGKKGRHEQEEKAGFVTMLLIRQLFTPCLSGLRARHQTPRHGFFTFLLLSPSLTPHGLPGWSIRFHFHPGLKLLPKTTLNQIHCGESQFRSWV